MLKTILRTTACLTLSAAAFIVITKMDATAARRRSSPPETTAPKDAPPKDAAPKPPTPKTAPAKLTAASLELPANGSTATAAPPATATLDSGGGLTMPDWKGKRLSVARREARKLGFTVAALDASDAPVPADMAAMYRVRRQLTKAGTPVASGATIEVRVREIAETAEGY
jgi:hypothetical protein